MAPFGPLDSKQDEQSEEERLAIARRYRERRGKQLRELAGAELDDQVLEAGEFSTMPIESLAAIPVLGALFAAAVRTRGSRRKLAPNVLVALDRKQVHLLSVRSEITGARAELDRSWPRDDVRVKSVTPRFMREEVVLEIAGEQQLKLYASSLRTNPWAAAVIRELGGEAPDPLDLSDPAPGSPAGD